MGWLLGSQPISPRGCYMCCQERYMDMVVDQEQEINTDGNVVGKKAFYSTDTRLIFIPFMGVPPEIKEFARYMPWGIFRTKKGKWAKTALTCQVVRERGEYPFPLYRGNGSAPYTKSGSQSWYLLKDAVRFAERFKNDYVEGVGIGLGKLTDFEWQSGGLPPPSAGKDWYLCCIDPDDSMDEHGELRDGAIDYIPSNVYTEFSPSGTGLKLLCFALCQASPRKSMPSFNAWMPRFFVISGSRRRGWLWRVIERSRSPLTRSTRRRFG